MERPVTGLPITYIIDYRDHLPDMEAHIEELRPSPPTLYHIGTLDTPMPSCWGAAFPHEPEGGAALADPEEIAQRLDTNRRFVAKLHEIGVRWVIPYICNQTLGGNRETRTGIWKFYDHWDDYREFGVGQRPAADPVDWMARERNGGLHFNYETRHPYFMKWGQFRFAPCMNNPFYNDYQRPIVRMIALAGYDGVFVDNCILNCYCWWCQDGFRRWLSGRSTAEDLAEAFGWSRPEQIQLGHRGSRIEWVKDDPLFRTFLAETLSPEERVKWLGTDDMERADVAIGGNGWLWGRANEYRRWAHARLSPDERELRWGIRSLDEWGIRDQADRLLWAETKRFWAESVCDNLEKIRRWGAEVLGHAFLILPNWGAMQSLDGNEFREEIGHDFRRWSPQSEYQMWEEDGDSGRVAPGIHLDYTLQYKFGFAHRARSAAMNARGDDGPTCALAHAEAAATGGNAFIQHGTRFPEIRTLYHRLFSDAADWFEGYTSAATVGLVYSYENLHLENTEHVKQVYRWSRYLDNQQVPFDYLLEEHIADEEYLRPYRLVIAPEVTYLSEEQCRALTSFVVSGGTLVLTGDIGSHDMHARPRAESPLTPLIRKARKKDRVKVFAEQGQLIWAPTVGDLIPTGALTREEMLDLARSEASALQGAASRYELMDAVDRAVAVERFLDPGPLASLVKDWERLQVADPYAACGVRVFPYIHLDGKSGAFVAHVVNYNISLTSKPGTRTVEAVKDLSLRFTVPDGWRVRRVESLEPGGSLTALHRKAKKGVVTLSLPSVEAYALVRVSLAAV